MDARNKLITQLAKCLLGNCARTSETRSRQAEVPNTKVVLVLGAGASVEAGLPLGKDAASIIKDRIGADKKLLKHELARLEMEYRLDRNEFETILLALNRFYPDRVVEELQSTYDHRYYVSLVYEIIAHLFKHRFIDAIINFNFDELLDQAIADELGDSAYYKVVDDGDCQVPLNNFVDGRFDYPMYAKPHGTSSQASSLRFTREDYFRTPPDMYRLMSSICAGTHVTLWSIGYAMQSLELNRILNADTTNIKKVFLMNTRPSPVSTARLKYNHRNLIGINKRYSLSSTLKKLWNEIHEQSGKSHRGIERHQMIARIFETEKILEEIGRQAPRDRKIARRAYLRDRTYVELAMAAAKAKGFVNLEQLAKSRVGRYFDLLQSELRGGSISLGQMCKDIGLNSEDYSRSTYCLPIEGKNRKPKNLTISKGDFRTLGRSRLFEMTCKVLGPTRSRWEENERAICRNFMELYRREEVEVSSDRGHRHKVRFAKPTVFHNLQSFQTRSRYMIEELEYSTLLCVAETGEWLLKDWVWEAISKGVERIVLVVCDERLTSELGKRLIEALKKQAKNRDNPTECTMEIYWLPWWEHNQHMTILIDKKKRMEGLYYERRLRSQMIAPIHLEGNDCNVLLDIFLSYTLKAERLAGSDFERDTLITRKNLKGQKARLL